MPTELEIVKGLAGNRSTFDTIPPSLRPPAPVEKTDLGPSLAVPAPGNSTTDYTTSGVQGMQQIRDGAHGLRPGVAPAVAAARREAEGG